MPLSIFTGMKAQIVLAVALIMLVRPLWPILEYVANYDYIVEVLCENRDRPQLNCDGKCYLAKQLAEQQKDHDKNPFGEQRSKLEIQPLVYFQPISPLVLGSAFQENDLMISHYGDNLHGLLSQADIDHPPKRV